MCVSSRAKDGKNRRSKRWKRKGNRSDDNDEGASSFSSFLFGDGAKKVFPDLFFSRPPILRLENGFLGSATWADDVLFSFFFSSTRGQPCIATGLEWWVGNFRPFLPAAKPPGHRTVCVVVVVVVVGGGGTTLRS